MSWTSVIEGVFDSCMDTFGPAMRQASKLVEGRRIESLEDLRAFARGLGYVLRYTPTLPLNAPGLSLELSGIRYIMIKTRLHPDLELYTIAHEIGHLELHLHGSQDSCRESREFEANLFAWSLLTLAGFPIVQERMERNRDVLLVLNSFANIGGAALLALLVSRFIQFIHQGSVYDFASWKRGTLDDLSQLRALPNPEV